ncbi:hypothetical protein JB92DRAFT_927994 [Gautieria morchelliformis]|nr:hypothetical protein JB92DRAFT_927994 [Gautieria morchelliformis]
MSKISKPGGFANHHQILCLLKWSNESVILIDHFHQNDVHKTTVGVDLLFRIRVDRFIVFLLEYQHVPSDQRPPPQPPRIHLVLPPRVHDRKVGQCLAADHVCPRWKQTLVVNSGQPLLSAVDLHLHADVPPSLPRVKRFRVLYVLPSGELMLCQVIPRQFRPLLPVLLMLVYPQLRLFSRRVLSYVLLEKSKPHDSVMKK